MTPHNNIGFNSKGFKDTATEITKKIAGSNRSTVVSGPSPRNPHAYLHEPYTQRRSQEFDLGGYKFHEETKQPPKN